MQARHLGKSLMMGTMLLVLLMVYVSPGMTQPKTDTLRVGVSASLSGPYVAWGTPCYQTIKTQARLYNETGGVKIGDKLYKIELIVEDDKAQSEPGAAAINKLIFREKLDYILLGGPSTAVALAGGPICTKNQVLFMSDGTSGPGLSSEWPWSFRVIETEYERSLALTVWLAKNKPEIKRIAYICPDTEGGHASTEAFLEIIKKYSNWEKVAGEYFEPGSKDYYPVVTKVLKEKPDLIYFGTANLGDTGLLAKQSRELGFNKIVLQPLIQEAKQITAISGVKAADDIYNPNLTYDITPEMKRLTDAYYKEWGEYNGLNMFACDFLYVLVQAMQKVGSTDKFRVKDTLEKGVFHSMVGPGARFYGKERYSISHQWLRPVCVSHIQNGETKVLAIVSPDELIRLIESKK